MVNISCHIAADDQIYINALKNDYFNDTAKPSKIEIGDARVVDEGFSRECLCRPLDNITWQNVCREANKTDTAENVALPE